MAVVVYQFVGMLRRAKVVVVVLGGIFALGCNEFADMCTYGDSFGINPGKPDVQCG